jgi:hypothetical protein
MEKSHNENDYHAKKLTLTVNWVGETDKVLLLLAYLGILFTENAENIFLDA